MSPDKEISAFAIYTKRKSLEQPQNLKKLKKKRTSQETIVCNGNQKAEQQLIAKQSSKEDHINTHAILESNNELLKIHSENNLYHKPVKCQSTSSVVMKKKMNGVTKSQPNKKTSSIVVRSKLGITRSRLRLLKRNKNLCKRKTSIMKKIKNTQQQQLLDNDGINCKNNHELKNNNIEVDPVENSIKLFEWLIYPIKAHDFKQSWEKAPVHIKRDRSSYYSHLVSMHLLDEILREENIVFLKNIDITSYSNGERMTHTPPGGRATASVVWNYYLNNCSVRMLNPQTFIPNIYALNATLQEYFGCFVGANLYLTPPNSQGFAPHYDDIEAFVLQIEGKKRWRLYKSLTENDYLSRYSSRNFNQSEIGEPILDTIVTAGDLLYFPRGTIHQAEAIDNTHSLHITLSVYQKNSWCDFLEKLIPEALQQASETDVQFREGLPLDYLKYIGTVCTADNIRRQTFKTKIKSLLTKLIDYIDIDNAADLMAKGHIHDFLPPCLTQQERKCSVAENSETVISKGIVKYHTKINSNTKIRLLRSHCIRLIREDDTYRLYFSTENSKEYHEYDALFLEVDEEFVFAIKKIIKRYPKFLRVGNLPIQDEENKLVLVRTLWEKGLIITDIALRAIIRKKSKKSIELNIS